jgi:hypothetical protein
MQHQRANDILNWLAVLGFAALCLLVPVALLILLFLFGDAHRQAFGDFYGRALLIIEALALGAVVFANSLRKKNRQRTAALVLMYCGAALLVSLGWFAHPRQIMDRAVERLADWEVAIAEYAQRRQDGEPDEDASWRVPAMRSELVSRRAEYQAALERHSGSAAHYQTPAYSYALIALGAVALLSAILFQYERWPFGRAP